MIFYYLIQYAARNTPRTCYGYPDQLPHLYRLLALYFVRHSEYLLVYSLRNALDD